jgi:hypothetical protein
MFWMSRNRIGPRRLDGTGPAVGNLVAGESLPAIAQRVTAT